MMFNIIGIVSFICLCLLLIKALFTKIIFSFKKYITMDITNNTQYRIVHFYPKGYLIEGLFSNNRWEASVLKNKKPYRYLTLNEAIIDIKRLRKKECKKIILFWKSEDISYL